MNRLLKIVVTGIGGIIVAFVAGILVFHYQDYWSDNFANHEASSARGIKQIKSETKLPKPIVDVCENDDPPVWCKLSGGKDE